MPGTELLISQPAQDLRPAAAGAEVSRLAAAAAAYADASKASSTRRAYESSWRGFAAWCARRRLTCEPPVDPATITGFLTDRAEAGAKVATLARAMAAIVDRHRELGEAPPASPMLRDVWAGIRRERGAPSRQKRALVTVDLRKLVGRLPPTLGGTRDKALLLIGFAGALRRSELVALELGETALNRCTFVAGGLELRLGRSKTDQEARGQVVAIPAGKTKLCPVAALRAWLDAGGIISGAIFRDIDRHGRVGSRALSDRAVALIVKRAAKRAGYDPALFSGHSLRAGLVTAAAQAGVPTELIMRQTRHKKAETVARYVREADLFARNAAGKVGL